MSVGIFISGRLNSERLPGKLLLPISDTTLWEIACEKLSRLPLQYNKYALAEEGQLYDIAKSIPGITAIKRTQDTALVDGPLKYIFKDLKNVKDTHLMFMNPCLCFLSTNTILGALKIFEQSNLDYGTSVKEYKNWLFEDSGCSINKIDYQGLSTKEIQPLWEAAHCFHIFNKENFFIDGMMLKEELVLLPVPSCEAIDIDTREDYEYVRWKYEICD